MKLIVANVQDQDADRVVSDLNQHGFRLTRIGSTGGFLQQGNTTILSGVEDEQANAAIDLLRKNSERRTRFMPMATGAAPNGMAIYNYVEVEIGGATVFVLDVDHFEQV